MEVVIFPSRCALHMVRPTSELGDDVAQMKDRVEYVRSEKVPGLVLGEARLSKFRFERHFHLDYHIGLVTEGAQRQRLYGEDRLLTPGTIQLMPPGEIHDGICADDGFYTLKTFRTSAELLNGVAEEITGKHEFAALGGAVFQDPVLARHLSRLHDVMRDHRAVDPMEAQSEWMELLHHLLSRAGMVKHVPIKGTLSPTLWQRVRDYCDTHLAEKITLDELATVCALERFQFLKLFKQTVGMTPHAWLVRLRLERACFLLGSTKWQLTQIAHEVGFYDQSHFTRAFRQAFGVPPSQY